MCTYSVLTGKPSVSSQKGSHDPVWDFFSNVLDLPENTAKPQDDEVLSATGLLDSLDLLVLTIALELLEANATQHNATSVTLGQLRQILPAESDLAAEVQAVLQDPEKKKCGY